MRLAAHGSIAAHNLSLNLNLNSISAVLEPFECIEIYHGGKYRIETTENKWPTDVSSSRVAPSSGVMLEVLNRRLETYPAAPRRPWEACYMRFDRQPTGLSPVMEVIL
ncbi:hypothetical protein AOL_s00097g483 [Orbilia oligospora ATCC 24927]|uniref:Uncharacterized protein n=1 Tax=Arthrobotrys oligospora (strain ATCC 24927 / CBS 115.81 / DSM 1491) TaxID=756982 RepID=G1XJF6_ARTOA|nr:hypothetical protein AOL_s00097g483 [Orbilia oligospora ATCC 24927]EGX46735.1 hypothetical protein AOL_s00097g483 [Orbilia oligospora ATCC 24927]